MTSKLVEAMNKEKMTVTENGDLTHATTANDFVDMFYNIGASRGNPDRLVPLFRTLVDTDLGLAVRMLLWVRDVRGGAGERAVFRTLVSKVLVTKLDAQKAERVIKKIPEIGRWDDVWRLFYKTKHQTRAFNAIQAALESGDALCAKWCPREKSAHSNVANALRRHMQMSNSQYRKTLTSLTKVVETQMCDNQWETIEFSHVPSQAMNIYSKAFARNASDHWEEFMAKVQTGEAKINAGAIYPYQLMDAKGTWQARYTMSQQQEAQWKALPDFAGDNDGMIMPVVDVSGSMMSSVGSDSSVTCMQVAVSLGLYLSERLKGGFKDSFMTFHESPSIETLHGTTSERLKQLQKAKWGGSTNFDGVFATLLDSAVKHGVAQEDMPHTLVIFSDMQFNCVRGSSKTAFERVQHMFEQAGYKMPQLVFWNLRATGNAPVTYDESGTALVSGFSPSMLKNLLAGEDMSPVAVMMKTLMNKRYNW